jgi:hypothetical protein
LVSYRDAGVDIEAGDALVEAIKPAAAATQRAGVMGGLGGFGALFDLKAAGFADPVLVSCTDGVGTKLMVAIESGRHDAVGIDLVAMCVNDLVVQGAEPLFFLDYFATGKLAVADAARVVQGIAEGCRLSGCALVGGGGAWRAAAARGAAGGYAAGFAGERGSFERVCAGAADLRHRAAGLGGCGPVVAGRERGRGADGANAAVCEAGAGAASRGVFAGGGAYHRRGVAGEFAARAAGRVLRGGGPGVAGAAGIFMVGAGGEGGAR